MPNIVLFFRLFADSPISLQSLCRLTVRKAVGVFRLNEISDLDVSPQVIDYLLFREVFLSINQVVDDRDLDVIPKLNQVKNTFLKKQYFYYQGFLDKRNTKYI